jgi:hypothetical protein
MMEFGDDCITQVLVNHHLGKNIGHLKRSRNPQSSNLMHQPIGNLLIKKEYPPSARPIHPGDDVEKGGLAGSIRTNNGMMLPLEDLQSNSR